MDRDWHRVTSATHQLSRHGVLRRSTSGSKGRLLAEGFTRTLVKALLLTVAVGLVALLAAVPTLLAAAVAALVVAGYAYSAYLAYVWSTRRGHSNATRAAAVALAIPLAPFVLVAWAFRWAWADRSRP